MTHTKEILTKAEVAELLQVSPSYVQKLIATRQLTVSRLGHKTVRIYRVEVERLMKRKLQ